MPHFTSLVYACVLSSVESTGLSRPDVDDAEAFFTLFVYTNYRFSSCAHSQSKEAYINILDTLILSTMTILTMDHCLPLFLCGLWQFHKA